MTKSKLGTGPKVMLYEDFSLKIEPMQGGAYPVIVLRSPAGEGRSSLHLPFDPEEIGDMRFDLGQTVRSSGRAPSPDTTHGATGISPQQVGDQLFSALFTGSVRSLYDQSMGMIRERQCGLRIKLHVDPEDPSLASLASLPWELMYRQETRDFLNLSRFTPIVRYLDVQRPYTPLPLQPPLRILVVISSPVGYAPLDLERERAQIEESWGGQENVDVHFLAPATITDLHDRLAERLYHVLHFMGHGDFDEGTGQGVLLMEKEDGSGDPVSGSALGVLLRDVPTLRLAFLNACDTARITKEIGLDPFAGVAAAMVMAGIPAVVAMQFPISDAAAITFARKFYSLLARNDTVDTAVAEGRRATYLAEAGTMEWVTPVLFMRTPQGIIFEVAPTPSPAEAGEAEAEEEKEAPLKSVPAKPVSKPRLPRWALAPVGAIVLIALVVAGALLIGGLGGEGTEVSPTAATVSVAATEPSLLTSPPVTVEATGVSEPAPSLAAPLDVELPLPVSAVQPEAQVLAHDDFQQLQPPWEYTGGFVKASDGLVEVNGAPDWGAYLHRPPSLGDNRGVLLVFRYDADSEFLISLMSGQPNKSDYREWSIGHDYRVTSRQGESDYHSNPLGGNLTWSPGTWYYLLLAIGQEGELVTRVWQHDDPSQQSEYRQMLGGDWAEQDWRFEISANQGKVYLDSYTEISYSNIR